VLGNGRVKLLRHSEKIISNIMAKQVKEAEDSS
jgi:hypothetical protein